MKLKMTFRMWILAVALLATVFAINPIGYFEHGVLVKSVDQNSSAYLGGLSKGEIIQNINGVSIKSLSDYSNEMALLFSTVTPINWTISTYSGNYHFESMNIGMDVDSNLTITSIYGQAATSGIGENEKVTAINGESVKAQEDFYSLKNQLEPKVKLTTITNKGTRVFFATTMDFTVSEIPSTRLKAGLDLAGGARALVMPEKKLSTSEMNDLIAVSKQRFNVYGIADINVKPASDLSGNNYMVVEVAGASPKELQELIGQQGKFEAKIGNDSVFVGGKKDITSVCRTDASCAGISGCSQSGSGYYCNFQFVIYLSPEAAKRQGDITSKLDINITSNGERVLSKNLELFLDDKLVDALQIEASLKGKTDATQIQIKGPGTGTTQQEAFDNAKANMAKLQTVLITGSLPYKLSIVKLDSISPLLGKEFIQNIFLAALGAAIGVSLVIFIRYRRIAFTLPILFTVASEIFIILGVAAAINWNLDLASIAGIIAAIGTGVDNQVVLIDESRNMKVSYSLKEKIKRAFFIIFGSFSTVFVAMIPLWWAGAGMLRGFAVTTIIGISIGVFITRPAFSDIISQIIE